jgi:hypothetical protein
LSRKKVKIFVKNGKFSPNPFEKKEFEEKIWVQFFSISSFENLILVKNLEKFPMWLL